MTGRGRSREVLVDYAENTSAHGIKKLTEKNGLALKLVWLVLLLVATALIVYQVTELTLLFLRRPVTTKTTISVDSPLFPGVTVCNLNPVQNSRTKPDLIYNTVVKTARLLNISSGEFESVEDPTSDGNEADPLFTTDNPFDEALLEFTMGVQVLPPDVLESMSQPFHNFLVSCQFGGLQCDVSNFSRTIDEDYGLCYTFPNTTSTPDGIRVFNSGPLYGLKLILNVEEHDYIPFITSSAGVRIQIHEFGSKPFPRELGQSLSTGFETQIGIKPHLSIRQPDPYGNCDQSTSGGVAVQECERICLEDNIKKSCSCTRKYTEDHRGEYVFCASTHVMCVKNVIKQKQEGKITCEACKSACRVYSYAERFSMTKWPVDSYDPVIHYLIDQWSTEDGQKAAAINNIRDSLLALNVFFSELTLTTEEEEPAYPWENLLSDIGGQLGLWLGISILSICEGFELVYLLVRNCCKPGAETKVTNID